MGELVFLTAWRDAVLAWYMSSLFVYLSVRHTRYCLKAAKPTIMETVPYKARVFSCATLCKARYMPSSCVCLYQVLHTHRQTDTSSPLLMRTCRQ